jgi:hypothetical protein
MHFPFEFQLESKIEFVSDLAGEVIFLALSVQQTKPVKFRHKASPPIASNFLQKDRHRPPSNKFQQTKHGKRLLQDTVSHPQSPILFQTETNYRQWNRQNCKRR